MKIRKLCKKVSTLHMTCFLRRPISVHFQKEIFKIILSGLFVFFVSTVPALAEEDGDYKQKKNISLTALAVHQFNANLDNGGDVSVSRYFVQVDLYRIFGVHYNLHDYSFSDRALLMNGKTLDKMHALGLDISLMFKLHEKWNLYLIPSIEFSGESGAEWSNSLIYGGIVAAVHKVNPDFSIGAGVGVFNRLEELRAFPMIVIDWKITEKLRLSNPFSGGPSGPAGLELSYEINDNWETGFGGAYRSFRYRLSDEGIVSKGIFQDRSVPVWGRLSWKNGPHVTIDFSAGAFVAGRMKIENEEGNDITEDNYDAAPFIALTVSVNF